MIPPQRALRGGEPYNEWVYDQRTEVYTRTWWKEYHDTWNGRPVVWRCTDVNEVIIGGRICAQEIWRWRYYFRDAGAAPAGAAPAGAAPAGAAPAAAAGAAPAGAAPAGEVPAGAVPAGEVPAAAVPAGEVPAGAVPAKVAPAGAAPAGTAAPMAMG